MASPTTHSLISPSGAHRWMFCTAAPRYEALFPAETTQYAAEGTLAHEICELYVQHTFCGKSKRAFNAALKKLQTDPLYSPEMLNTAETYIGHLLERANKFKRLRLVLPEMNVSLTRWIPEGKGQCDCAMIGDDTLHITDYKHGKGVPVSAENNPQMRLYALGVLDSLDKPEGYYSKFPPAVFGRIKRVTMSIVQPRINSIKEDVISVDDLLAWGETAKEKAQIAYDGKGEFCPGEKQCKFCRGRYTCPALSGANMALEEFSQHVTLDKAGNPLDPTARKALGLPPVLTNAEIGDLLTRGAMLVAWYSDLKEYALSALLKGEEIPGYKAVEGKSDRAFSDADKARELLLGAGYSENDLVDIKPKTLAGIEKMMGKKQFAELLGTLVMKPRGKPTLAEEADMREPYNSAAAEFGGVTSNGQ